MNMKRVDFSHFAIRLRNAISVATYANKIVLLLEK